MTRYNLVCGKCKYMVTVHSKSKAKEIKEYHEDQSDHSVSIEVEK